MVTFLPERASSRAAIRPAAPAPTIKKMCSSLREHYPIPMPRAKKPSQLSAKERALLNRPDHSSEEEIKRLTTRAAFAYFKIIDKVDSRATGRPRAPCLQLRTPIDDENTRQYFLAMVSSNKRFHAE
jgi:hypothetical protein